MAKTGFSILNTLKQVLTLGFLTGGNDIEVTSGDMIYQDSVTDLGNTSTALGIDLSNTSSVMKCTVTDNFTLTFTNLRVCNGWITATIGGAGSYTIAFSANCEFKSGGTTPTLSSAIGAKDRIYFACDGTNVEISINNDIQ